MPLHDARYVRIKPGDDERTIRRKVMAGVRRRQKKEGDPNVCGSILRQAQEAQAKEKGVPAVPVAAGNQTHR